MNGLAHRALSILEKSMQMRYLSYPLRLKNPVYGAVSKEMEINSVKSMMKGDTCNVSRFALENHWGTHIDCPAHFFNNGLKVIDYPPNAWVFRSPFVRELELKENQLLAHEDIGDIPEKTDLLLIKSSFYRYRGTEKYSYNNPGISPEMGEWLRRDHPGITAIGFDFISLSPYQNREMGRKAHRVLLDPEGANSPVRIIEDMDLSYDLTALDMVFAFPLIIEGLDSAPCTILGSFKW